MLYKIYILEKDNEIKIEVLKMNIHSETEKTILVHRKLDWGEIIIKKYLKKELDKYTQHNHILSDGCYYTRNKQLLDKYKLSSLKREASNILPKITSIENLIKDL